MRALITPAPDTGVSRDGRLARFAVVEPEGPDSRGRRQVSDESQLNAARVGEVIVPREQASGSASDNSDASGRLILGQAAGARNPDIVTFAGTRDLAAAEFRHESATQEPAWPLPPSSSIALYWLYESLGPGDSVTFSYRYQATGADGAAAEIAPPDGGGI